MARFEQRFISDFLSKEYRFFIPSYQRGYKWTELQVRELLEDIDSFDSKGKGYIYCLQPVVVKKDEINKNYRVIDGQQRLTTIYLILCFIKQYLDSIKELYSIEYEVREKSGDYLLKFATPGFKDNQSEDNIDYHYIKNTYDTVQKYFKNKNDEDIRKFGDKLINKTNVIWYECDSDDNENEVFTHLNSGKIKLTSSELIKGLLLNLNNFITEGENSENSQNLNQSKIAMEWDKIESTLQNDQFWYFINGSHSSTRISYIFELFMDLNKEEYEELQNIYNATSTEGESFSKFLGNDDYKIYRYFDYYIKMKNNRVQLPPIGSNLEQLPIKTLINCLWENVKKIFKIITEWYNDIKLYHYVGFIINRTDEESPKEKMLELLKIWYEDKRNYCKKEDFINKLKNKIKEGIYEEFKSINKPQENLIEKLKDYEFDIEGHLKKTKLRNLLLLHNIQYVIKHNSNFEENKEKYKDGIFYKFPFHLYKEENWDIEHINPATPKEFKTNKEIKDYLISVYCSGFSDEIKNDAKNLMKKINNSDENEKQASEDVLSEYRRLVEKMETLEKDAEDLDDSDLGESDRNKLWNFVLLDSNTNRGYGNSLFSMKRVWIIGKDSGQKYEFKEDTYKIGNDNGKDIDKKKSFTSFIVPCTKNAFLKYYNVNANNLMRWSKKDAKEYLKDIEKQLSDILKEDEEKKDEQ